MVAMLAGFVVAAIVLRFSQFAHKYVHPIVLSGPCDASVEQAAKADV